MDFTTILMLALGGYLIYSKLGTSGGVVAGGGTNTTNANQQTVSQQQQVNQTMAAQTLQSVAAKMQTFKDDPNGYHSVDQWNYYYKMVRGIAGPDQATLFPNDTPGKLYGIMEWWSAMTGQGFSGMGVIARHVNPYQNPVQGLNFGSNIRPNASETATVKWTN